jgi:SAM-dependent methyltransferase
MVRLQSVLEWPAFYRLHLLLLVGRQQERFVRDHVRPEAGQRLLDLGCGPGDVLEHLHGVDYVGVDLNPRYVEAARARFGSRGDFRCGSASDLAEQEPGAFDLATANGLLHHLDDDEVGRLLRVARKALRPGGRLVTIDPCYVAGQSPVARLLLGMDRGRHVRTLDRYQALARAEFGSVEAVVRHDLIRLPYTHVIMECRAESAAREAA